ncbi:two-component sensor histidine kinase AdeS [Acinetobacter soli]|uniref:two-component sensor histidine kinase AdeS n=1 Tax=Acinetobacter soli TaxID=487316 RepID=UPI00124E99A6|nr:two-component sensor histidine kinase AdeS [Acinetobacter soli]
MRTKLNKNSIGISAQLLIMMSVLNLGITIFSFGLGYLVYGWATEKGLLDLKNACPDNFSFTSVDYLWTFLVVLTGFLLSTFLAFRYAKRYTQPINALANVVKQIQQGNLSLRIEQQQAHIPHELMSLIQNFNAMANQLEISVKNSTLWNAAIAHELRTPITILQGRLQGIVDGVFEADPQLHQSLLSQVEGLSYLVEDLRTLTLVENQQFRLDIQETNLQNSIFKCFQMFQDRFEHKGLHVVFNLTHEKARCDVTRMEQVLIALFSNASRYADAGKLSITTKTTQDHWILMLEDQGPGIDEQHLEHLFKPFYRLEESRSRSEGGTGLGLAVIYAIIEAHQGQITYTTSTDLGGSCFTILLKKS